MSLPGAQVLSSQQRSTGEASKYDAERLYSHFQSKSLFFVFHFNIKNMYFHHSTEQRQSGGSPESTLLKVECNSFFFFFSVKFLEFIYVESQPNTRRLRLSSRSWSVHVIPQLRYNQRVKHQESCVMLPKHYLFVEHRIYCTLKFKSLLNWSVWYLYRTKMFPRVHQFIP